MASRRHQQRTLDHLTRDERLSDPALYGQDPDAFHAAVERRKAAQEELGSAEEEWLALEILREEGEIQHPPARERTPFAETVHRSNCC